MSKTKIRVLVAEAGESRGKGEDSFAWSPGDVVSVPLEEAKARVGDGRAEWVDGAPPAEPPAGSKATETAARKTPTRRTTRSK